MPEKKSKKSAWLWPLGILAAGVTGVAAVAVRGCWHKSMSWPVRAGRWSYQVCTTCGIKRLFDEHTFQGYGPYSYNLAELIEISQAESRQAKADAAESSPEAMVR
jgi:hypothetical protein